MRKMNQPPEWAVIAIVICATLAFLIYTGLLLQEGFSWVKFIPALCWAIVLIVWLSRYRRSKREQTVSDTE